MRVLWLFLLWGLVEIGLFAGIGGQIGVLGTWGLVLGSAALGILVIRRQKRRISGPIVHDLKALRGPLTPAAHSALLVLAGILLILPGFLGDALGLLLLIPQVRSLLILILAEKARSVVMERAMGAVLHRRPPAAQDAADVIDGEAVEISPEPPTPPTLGRHKPSGWTKP